MNTGVMTFSIITLIFMVVSTVLPAITPKAPIEAGGIEITPVTTPDIQSATLAAQNVPGRNTMKGAVTESPSTSPAIKVIFYPFSVIGDTNLTIKWEVSGGTLGEISHTAIYWGYKSANIPDYPRVSNLQTGKTQQEFRGEIKAPAGGDFYFRAHAVVDGVNVYSPEYQITIIAPMGGGGGEKTIAIDATKIEIDDVDNKIKYHVFNKGENWNITLLNVATKTLAYQFNDTIGEPDTTDKNWFVWFGNNYQNELHGIQRCIVPGSYNVYANASHNGIIIEKSGDIIVNSSEACQFPPAPAPELNPVILILAGLMGILLVARKNGGNFS